MRRHARLPYAASTLHAEYVEACYDRRALFVSFRSGRGELKGLVFLDERLKRLTWDFGPVFSGPSDTLAKLVENFAAWVHAGGFCLRHASTAPLSDMTEAMLASLLATEFEKRSVRSSLAGTYLVNLDERIWERAVYRSGGKNRSVATITRRCLREGVSIYDANTCTDLYRTYRLLMSETLARVGGVPQDPERAVAVLAHQDAAGWSTSLIALHNGRALAAVNVVASGHEAYVRKLAYSDLCRSLRLGASYLVVMKALEWAHARGLRILHLPLVRLGVDEKVAALRRFKSRFGGEFHPVLELTSEPGKVVSDRSDERVDGAAAIHPNDP